MVLLEEHFIVLNKAERAFLESKLSSGYIKAAEGRGRWAGYQKIDRIVAAYNPAFGEVSTIEYPRTYFFDISRKGFPEIKTYSEEDFKEYAENNRIIMEDQIDIAQAVNPYVRKRNKVRRK